MIGRTTQPIDGLKDVVDVLHSEFAHLKMSLRQDIQRLLNDGFAEKRHQQIVRAAPVPKFEPPPLPSQVNSTETESIRIAANQVDGIESINCCDSATSDSSMSSSNGNDEVVRDVADSQVTRQGGSRQSGSRRKQLKKSRTVAQFETIFNRPRNGLAMTHKANKYAARFMELQWADRRPSDFSQCNTNRSSHTTDFSGASSFVKTNSCPVSTNVDVMLADDLDGSVYGLGANSAMGRPHDVVTHIPSVLSSRHSSGVHEPAIDEEDGSMTGETTLSTKDMIALRTQWAGRSVEVDELGKGKVLASTNLAAKAGGYRLNSMEQAMGLMPVANAVGDPMAPFMRHQVTKVIRGRHFKYTTLTVICASAILSGIQADFAARHLKRGTLTEHRVIEVLFSCYFAAEVALKLFAYGWNFFTGFGWVWNILDLILILACLVRDFFQVLVDANAIDDTKIVRRTITVFRSLQIFRLLHLTRFSTDLRVLLSCLAHSLQTFFWAVALLALVTYVMGILLTYLTADARRALDGLEGTSGERLEHGFGSLSRTFLSLFQSVSGGVDWDTLSRPLIHSVSIWCGIFFGFYIAFILFAVLNLLTAVFVQAVMERAEVVKEKHKMAQAWKVFQSIDIDCSGHISRDEMQSQLAEPAVQEYFQSIDLDASELHTLFDIIDMSGDGTVDFQEFLNGCLRFQGAAKSVDVLLIMQEMRSSFKLIEQALTLLYEAQTSNEVQSPTSLREASCCVSLSANALG